jgi:hypothetical protein
MKYHLLKREGPLGGGPFPNLNQKGTQTKAWNAFPQPLAQGCRHPATHEELMPRGYPHYAKVICDHCKRFIRWSAKPETIVRARLNLYRIAKLTMHEGLDPWQRNFVKSVAQCRKISPKQQQVLDDLVTQYLGGVS